MHFACSDTYPLRAAGNAISDLPVAQQQNCKAPPIPWLSMNGTDDLVVPFAGMKQSTMVRGQAQPALLSADDTFHFFAQRAGCGTVVKGERLPHLNTPDPTYAERRTCTGRDGKASIQFVFHGAGHTLPNRGHNRKAQRAYGLSNQDADAGQIIWDFFKSTM
jgi:poly(3-hydroxybutyrate) depolymerase